MSGGTPPDPPKQTTGVAPRPLFLAAGVRLTRVRRDVRPLPPRSPASRPSHGCTCPGAPAPPRSSSLSARSTANPAPPTTRRPATSRPPRRCSRPSVRRTRPASGSSTAPGTMSPRMPGVRCASLSASGGPRASRASAPPAASRSVTAARGVPPHPPANVIHVERGWDMVEGEIATKGRNRRRVPIPSVLREHLLAHLMRSGRRDDQLVFGETERSPIDPRRLSDRADDAWRNAGRKRIVRTSVGTPSRR